MVEYRISDIIKRFNMELKKNGILEQILDEVSSASEKGILEQIVDKIDEMNQRLINIEESLLPKLDLTKRDGVRKYLGISESSLSKKMKNNDLINGIHYKREINGGKTKITFIESAIISYKNTKSIKK
jgi:hypothetical protein